MKIIKKAQAGSFESSDILILAAPVEEGEGRDIQIESGVFMQYGETIEKLIHQVLDQFEVKDVQLQIHDKGAIEPVILARMETVIQRALEQQKGTMY